MKQGANGSILNTVVFFVIILGFFIYTIYQQNRKEKQKDSMRSQLKEGDMVQTTSGIVGIIGFISEDKKIVELKTGINFASKISINIQSIYEKLDSQ